MTINDLAVVVNNGFKKLDQKIDNLAEATAKGFAEVDQKFEAVDKKFEVLENKMNDKFDIVTNHLSRIDSVSVGNLTRRVENLEDFRLVVKTKLKLKQV